MSIKNPIGWFEICVTDFEKAKNFYSSIFDWEFKLSQASDTTYWNIYTGEESIGGGLTIREASDNIGQSIILYTEVENIDETLEMVSKSGGEIEEGKTLISESAGYYGLFKDLDGNTMGLWAKE